MRDKNKEINLSDFILSLFSEGLHFVHLNLRCCLFCWRLAHDSSFHFAVVN